MSFDVVYCYDSSSFFSTPEAPNEENFKFGDVLPEDIESVQKPLPPPDERPIRPVLRRTNRQPGVCNDLNQTLQA